METLSSRRQDRQNDSVSSFPALQVYPTVRAELTPGQQKAPAAQCKIWERKSLVRSSLGLVKISSGVPLSTI